MNSSTSSTWVQEASLLSRTPSAAETDSPEAQIALKPASSTTLAERPSCAPIRKVSSGDSSSRRKRAALLSGLDLSREDLPWSNNTDAITLHSVDRANWTSLKTSIALSKPLILLALGSVEWEVFRGVQLCSAIQPERSSTLTCWHFLIKRYVMTCHRTTIHVPYPPCRNQPTRTVALTPTRRWSNSSGDARHGRQSQGSE